MKRNYIIRITLTLLLPTIFIGCITNSKQVVTKVSSSAPNKIIETPKQEEKKEPENITQPIDISTDKVNLKENVFTPTILPSVSGLSTQNIEWSWAYSPKSSSVLLSKYHAYAYGDTSRKDIYLTFDEGYEYGYTSSILDTLKANNVQATFFVTQPYVTGTFNGVKDVDLLKRMGDEGHIIGNHSVHHKSMASIKDETAFNSELIGVESAVAKIPALKVSKYFRPPMGDFSELSLYYTQKLGYKTVFYALAYHDYDVNNQPDPQTSKSFLLKSTKPGMICLLHAESKTNATILDSLIKEWKNEGYTFKTLDQLP